LPGENFFLGEIATIAGRQLFIAIVAGRKLFSRCDCYSTKKTTLHSSSCRETNLHMVRFVPTVPRRQLSQDEVAAVPGKPCTTLLMVRYQQFQENMHHSSQDEIPTVRGRPCTTHLMVRYQQFQEKMHHSSQGEDTNSSRKTMHHSSHGEIPAVPGKHAPLFSR
jgi:hypothetical protein